MHINIRMSAYYDHTFDLILSITDRYISTAATILKYGI